MIYGKTASNAIAVMSYLVEHAGTTVGSSEIAKIRGISRPLTAKLLTQLSAAGMVKGQPGPGGGYTLAKDPAEISLMSIVELFEQTEAPSLCPFGSEWCGNGDPCPLHDTLLAFRENSQEFLEKTSLAVFKV